MITLMVGSVDEALCRGVALLRKVGVKQTSRAGDVWVAPSPVTTIFHDPVKRVLFNAHRDANPFFHLFESLWLLAGRDDATWLDQFVGDFSSRFAESDGVLHGSYGHRWREALGLDQLFEVVEKLKANPDDRQCVLQMWDARDDWHADGEYSAHSGCNDLLGNWKDRPCLAGDTVVWSPEGDLPIAALAEKFAAGVKRWPVYSVNEMSKKLEIRWATNCWRSGRRRTVVLTFDDGTSIRATADHVFYVYPKRIGRNGKVSALAAKPCRVDKLRPGDRVLATQRFSGKKGHEVIKKCLAGNTAFRNMQQTHNAYYRLVYGSIPEDCELHHVDEVKRNNKIANLEPLDPGEHSRLHKVGDRNPMRNMTAAQHRARGRKQSVSLKAAWAKLTPMQRVARSKGLPITNHRIVSIGPGPIEDVYDFTVPGFHTAIVGTGVVTHNCNTHAYLRVRDGLLDLTVCCRSNDIIWGAYGANAVQFSMLQEYLAARIGVGVGIYYQISNNYHAYDNVIDWSLGEKNALTDWGWSYRDFCVEPLALVTNPETFDRELSCFFKRPESFLPLDPVLALRTGGRNEYENLFFPRVAVPLYRAIRTWKDKAVEDRKKLAIQELDSAPAENDWKLAAQQWMQKRIK